MKTKKTEFVILGLLSIAPFSGYEMKKFVEKNIGHFWSESNGQLYPSLSALLKKGCIVLECKETNKNKESHIYAITDIGRKQLTSWLEEKAEEKSCHRDEGLLKLFFGNNNSTELSIVRIRERERKCQEKLKEYEAIQKEIEKRASNPNSPYWMMILDNGITSEKAELAWCKKSIKTLEALS